MADLKDQVTDLYYTQNQLAFSDLEMQSNIAKKYKKKPKSTDLGNQMKKKREFVIIMGS